MEQIVFRNEFVPDEKAAIKSILDYEIEIMDIKPEETHYMALGMNYSVAGFELILTRKMSFYIVTYYLPSGLFVVVSWISFLVNPEVIPGRMTLLVTIFLVLINIFNTIQTNSPKAEGLTAIEAWVIACIIFVFGALGEYTVILLKIKLKKVRTSIIKRYYIMILNIECNISFNIDYLFFSYIHLKEKPEMDIWDKQLKLWQMQQHLKP